MTDGIARPVGQQAGRAAPLPIRVRRATPGDTRAVLDFTRATWDGWDYVPSVWGEWLEAPDGVLLVALPAVTHELDLFGRPLSLDRPIGIARVAMLSAHEAWLEGLRVDPGVRTRGVARLINAAGLEWARAQGATIVRYATGEANEGSHRIAARSGFRMLRPWRSWQPPRDEDVDEEDAEAHAAERGDVEADGDAPHDAAADLDQFADLADEPEGEVPEDVAARATGIELGPTERAEDEATPPPGDGSRDDEGSRATAGRPAQSPAASPAESRRRLRRAGLSLDPRSSLDEIDGWYARLTGDPTFRAGDGLCEARSWAFQELTRERFVAHVRAGEVLVTRSATDGRNETGARRKLDDRPTHDRWALVVMPLSTPRFAADRPWAAVAAGDGDALLRLAIATRDALVRPIRLRLPDAAPALAGFADDFTRAGFPPASETLHLFERALTEDAPIDTGPAGALTLEEAPRRVAAPYRDRE